MLLPFAPPRHPLLDRLTARDWPPAKRCRSLMCAHKMTRSCRCAWQQTRTACAAAMIFVLISVICLAGSGTAIPGATAAQRPQLFLTAHARLRFGIAGPPFGPLCLGSARPPPGGTASAGLQPFAPPHHASHSGRYLLSCLTPTRDRPPHMPHRAKPCNSARTAAKVRMTGSWHSASTRTGTSPAAAFHCSVLQHCALQIPNFAAHTQLTPRRDNASSFP
mmetsp:Transcript_25358/g.58412  ORF Transcript_25358/g.58412 Transcript_25358/m.58412 type:complete len:220 (+) Transcript_25358:1294-1953(+)